MLGLVASGRIKWGNDKTQMISKKCIMFLGRKNKPNLYGGKKRKMPMLMASGKTKNENNKMISCTNASNIKGIGKLYLLMVSLEGACARVENQSSLGDETVGRKNEHCIS